MFSDSFKSNKAILKKSTTPLLTMRNQLRCLCLNSRNSCRSTQLVTLVSMEPTKYHRGYIITKVSHYQLFLLSDYIKTNVILFYIQNIMSFKATLNQSPFSDTSFLNQLKNYT